VVVPREYFRDRVEKADPILNVFLRVVLDRFRATHQARIRGDESLVPADDDRESDYDLDKRRVLDDLQRQHELERALEQDELVLHYQPIVDLRRGGVVGFEALMRWHHPTRGLVPPGDFIGFAERAGTIVPMGLWALREAPIVLRRFQHIHRQKHPSAAPLFISVNVSGRQLGTLQDVDAIIEALGTSGIDLPNVTLELTETLLMHDPRQAAASLERLRKVGVSLAIDDFGTGYSSLGYLHRFPIDRLKIDRSFVDAMLEDESSMKIVRIVTHLAQELEMKMIAEGIETLDQLGALRDLGCSYAQGYLFARPQPADAIASRLESGDSFIPQGG
jgi:EAL domain-containing protein (putative c-di-GMP-specific phosphodiesterase class I)